MKILFDHQIFTIQEYGGISNYFSKLYENFKVDNNVEPEIVLRYSNNTYLIENNDTSFMQFFPSRSFRGRYRIQNFLNKKESIKKIKKEKFDIFHPTYYDPYFLKYIENKPFVLTVFDMIHEKYIKNPKDKVIEWKKLLLKKAGKVISISNNTKNDIIEILGLSEEKISVIYLGGNAAINNIIKPNIEIPNKYLLYIGLRNGYKNFSFFLNSVASVLKKDPSLYLVCIGGGRFNKSEKSLLKSLHIIGRVFQYSLENKYLPYIYKNALVFILPSLCEGFGIPILEAYGAGCPAALSNYGAIPEVGGDCAVYFDPKSKESIKDSILKLLVSEKFRKELALKGKERAKKFSWVNCTQETLKVYNSIIK